MAEVRLQDRYEARSGRILINGVRALVRLMLVQADLDAKAGLNTGGFVSGYRGSPLGGLDTAFGEAASLTAERNIVVKPGVNEELAATAVAGSQQIERSPGAKVDGIFSLWYGKGPGLDRASDAIRHIVNQGTSAKGGVVLAVGDDHLAKSSSIVCFSDDMVAGLQVPLFYPADPAEIVEYGLHSFAISRHTGAVTALKIITEVADATQTVPTGEMDFDPVLPAVPSAPAGLHNVWPLTPLDQESRHVENRLPAIAAYVRANRLDKIKLKEPGAKIGFVAPGKSWLDLQEAFYLLGLDENRLKEMGVALYKPAMIWPLEGEGLREFAAGLETLFVVEEKRPFVEAQAKEILYGVENAPAVWGKSGPDGTPLLSAVGALTPEQIAARIGEQLAKLTGDDTLRSNSAAADCMLGDQLQFAIPPQLRKPFFCSGCPHNRSTAVPEGSRAMAGIGCHGLAAYNQPQTGTFAQMGGEGVHWMGLAPFTEEPHVFANMGDGTYFHSGLLAIRQSVSAKVNMTYKILYNSAVAMTGGQSVDGELSVEQMIDQVLAEGVASVTLCADDLDRYPAGHPARAKVERVLHRDEMEGLQRELRGREGVSVILYDQVCATEKRRLRKRGKMEDPTTRVFINDLVCEGCGDCSVKSNCLSVEPVHTPFGTKRKINQTTCNKDYSCLEGFCPSFVTVEGGKPRSSGNGAGDFDGAGLPAPVATTDPHQRVLVAGIGGTGVVTVGALMVMASHIDGRQAAVLDMTGMAQKGGAVISHIHVSEEPINALRVPTSQASLVIACDEVVGNQRDVIAAIDPGKTWVVANTDVPITGDFTRNREAMPDTSLLERRLRQRAGEDRVVAHPFTRMAEKLFGNAIGSNLMMLGFSWQKGWLELDFDAIHQAIELNRTAVAMNKAAFAWGRRLAVEPEAVYEACALTDPPEDTLDEVIERRAAFLVDYQDAAYAQAYRDRIASVRAAEGKVGGDGSLAMNAAKALFRLMAYKDEYEVARLHTDGTFAAALGDAFEGDYKIAYHMAPPLISPRDKTTGHLRKRRFGGWMTPLFRLLARGKSLRGTAWDLFGRSHERREERALIAEYSQLLEQIVSGLDKDNYAAASELAGLVLDVRGYGHVKDAAIAQYRADLPAAMAAFSRPAAAPAAAAEPEIAKTGAA